MTLAKWSRSSLTDRKKVIYKVNTNKENFSNWGKTIIELYKINSRSQLFIKYIDYFPPRMRTLFLTTLTFHSAERFKFHK